jgi:predicted exporter
MQEFLSSSLLSAGNLSPHNDVLAARVDGSWYVMLRMTLTPEAVSLDRDKNAVREIYAFTSAAKETKPGLEFYFSGIPFHSYESSSNAQKEISFISTVTLLIILALFLYVFRSPLPVLSSLLAVLLSLGLAAATALLVFREIHILTFVFGTTLIGLCVDYSAHFFIHWKGNPGLKDGYAIRSHISKSMIMCFVSTEICFFIFLFAPFPILKQFAVFSMAGLLSSFLTAFCLYPLLKVPPEEKRVLRVFTTSSLSGFQFKYNARLLLFAALAVAALVVIIFSRGVKIHNDITSLYTMSASMMESEKRAAMVLDQHAAPWYFIISGASQEETLENEQTLALRLEEEISNGNLKSFLGTSVFVPSLRRQRETYEAMKALLPMARAQYEYLGFPPEYAMLFYDEFAAGRRYCLPEHAPHDAGLSNLWIGEAGGNFYSCVLLFHPENEEIFRAIAGEYDFVHFINKAQDIGRDLDTLTRTMAFFFLVAYIVISILVRFVYKWRDSFRICAVPLFVAIATIAVFAAGKMSFGFFSAAALVLVFSLGLDFIFYMTGLAKKNSPTALAVLLSFLTSLLSFGALGFSSFVPVHIFGLTVSIGLGAAFISTMLLTGKSD